MEGPIHLALKNDRSAQNRRIFEDRRNQMRIPDFFGTISWKGYCLLWMN